MSLIKPILEVLHSVKAKLYPSRLPGRENEYIARSACEAVLKPEDVCAAAIDRGGFTGTYEDMVSCVRMYHHEMMYQLCNGNAVDNGYFSVRLGIKGSFRTPHDAFDPKRHKITFKFRADEKMRRLKEYIRIDVQGLARTQGAIDLFYNIDRNSDVNAYTPGDFFYITGVKIRLFGPDPECGVYLVPVDDPAAAVKITRLVKSTSTKLIAMAPRTGHRYNRIEVRTQYTGSINVLLKTPRIITSRFILEEC